MRRYVFECDRCGKAHWIVFQTLSNSEEYTHWGTCPVFGEPILAAFKEEETEKKFGAWL